MGGIVERKQRRLVTKQLQIVVRIRTASVRNGRIFLEMAVIVILVDDRIRTGCIDDGDTQRTGSIDEPVIPSGAAYNKGRYFPHHAFGEYEIVAARRRMQNSTARSLSPESLLPVVTLEVDGGIHIQVPTLAHHEEALRGDAPNRCDQVGEKNDIGIYIHNEPFPSHLLGKFKGRIE